MKFKNKWVSGGGAPMKILPNLMQFRGSSDPPISPGGGLVGFENTVNQTWK